MTRLLQERESVGSGKLVRITERSVFSDRNVFVASAQEAGWLSELELDLYHSWSCPTIKVRVSDTPSFSYNKPKRRLCPL